MISFTKRSLLVALVSARSLAAQRASGDTLTRDTTVAAPDSTAPALHFTSRSADQSLRFDRRLATGLVLGSLAIIPLDKSAESSLQRPGLQSNSGIHSAAGFNWLGGTGFLASSVACCRTPNGQRSSQRGRTAHHRGHRRKRCNRRRDERTGGPATAFLEKTDPADFFVGRGFANGGLTSFPSGHTAAAFRAATVLSLEARRTWPRAAPVVTPLLYGGATAVGLARMYDSKHWASDVALGATIGTFTGLQVMRYNDAHPDNRVARWLTHTSVAPNGSRGMAIGLSLPLR